MQTLDDKDFHDWLYAINPRYAGLIPPHVPIILIVPKHIWNTTFRLVILGKLDGPTHPFRVLQFPPPKKSTATI
jgi:hypothetical protein